MSELIRISRECRSADLLAVCIGACTLGVLVLVALGQAGKTQAFMYFCLCALALTVTDGMTRRLPNALVISLWTVGVGSNALAEGWVSWEEAWMCSAAAFLFLGSVSFLTRTVAAFSFGMGDAKLIAAISAWGGWVMLYSTVLWGSVLAALWLVVSGRKVAAVGPFYVWVGAAILGFSSVSG